MLAYDWIRAGDVFPSLSRETGTNIAARIERDLFRNAAEQVLANPEQYHNMSPAAWRMLVVTGRVIGEPRYVHEVVRRARHFMESRFFYDGAWSEGTPDYGFQSVSWLEGVLHVLKGYSDPPGYRAQDRTRFDNLDLEKDLPSLRRANEVLLKMRLPDGRSVPVHDTWHNRKRSVADRTEPYLLPGLGHACLGGGIGPDQTQLHLTWSGAYGHDHADNLSVLLFAHGREPLSDLGYTHTKARGWTMATVAHNTVVIDGQNQTPGKREASPTDGSLRYFDVADRRVQVVSADGIRGYPGLARVYRRTLISVDAGKNRRYAVDVFEVDGGQVHDYFLHGDADRPGTVSIQQNCEPLQTLLPAGIRWDPPRNEGDRGRMREAHYAYGYLRNLREASALGDTAFPVTFEATGGAKPALRVTLIPESGSRLILGENPSVRGAGEDDARLEEYARPFVMLRHQAKNGRSLFASVLEPYADRPFITAVERIVRADATLVLRIRIGDRTDLVVYNAGKTLGVEAEGSTASFAGAVGVLSLHGKEVEHAYALGEGGWTLGEFTLRSFGPRRSRLRAVEDRILILEDSRVELPKAGDIVRLVTADGWVYPFTVVVAERSGDAARVLVAEGPGLNYVESGGGRLCLSTFPQREPGSSALNGCHEPFERGTIRNAGF